jgi:hypothetical protein
MAADAFLGSYFCNLSSDSYPWTGLQFNKTSSKWRWGNGSNITTVVPHWTVWSGADDTGLNCGKPTCNETLCGEVFCGRDDPWAPYGNLYTGNCSKGQQILCQIKCKWV